MCAPSSKISNAFRLFRMYVLNSELAPVTETAPFNTVHLMVTDIRYLCLNDGPEKHNCSVIKWRFSCLY